MAKKKKKNCLVTQSWDLIIKEATKWKEARKQLWKQNSIANTASELPQLAFSGVLNSSLIYISVAI